VGFVVRMATGRRWGGLIRHHDFRMLWIGESTSKIGSTMTVVAMPLVAVLALNADTVVVGLVQAAAWLPWVVFGLPAGAWVDRLRPRRIMLVCDVASLVLFATIPLAAWAGALSTVQLVAVALLAGVASVFFSTAYQSYLPALLLAADLPEANAKLQGSESAAQVLGPALGGVLAQFFGAVSALLADALTFAVSALCLLRIQAPDQKQPRQQRGQRTSLRADIAEGVRFIAHNAYLRAITLYGCVANLAFTATQAVLVVFLVRTVGLSPGIAGALIAVAGIGGVIGAMLSVPVTRRFGTARGMLLCEAFSAPFALLVPLTTAGAGVLLFLVGTVVQTIGVVASNIIAGTFRQSYVPAALMGRVTATTRFVIFAGMPLGALAGGGLGAAIGPRNTIWLAAAVTAASVCILAVKPIRRSRDFPSSPAA
jgi:predicted MFS family arabinose efflux permease